MPTQNKPGAHPHPTPHQALQGLLDIVDWQGRPATDVMISDNDPILPANFRIGAAGAVSLAAQGLAADALHQLRSGANGIGRRQKLAVSHRAGAMAMRSNRHVRLDGADSGERWADLSGLYPCADGRWVQLHCNYPWLRDGILDILKCDAARPAVAAALMTWPAQAFEDAVAEVNLCAFMVRSADEWSAHPQSAAVARQPVVSVEKIGTAPIEPLTDYALGVPPRPLAGVRALELARVLAGPVCGRTLAGHGADVMRIGCSHQPDDEGLVMDTGHGKLSAHLDLRDADQMATLHKLIKQADVFTQGHRPGTIAGRGLGPEQVAKIRPGIVYVSLSAWGTQGPWAHRRGFDSLVQCATGFTAEHGSPEQPKHLPAQALDYVSGYLAAFGAMEGLRRRATVGGSWLVRVSLAQTAHWIDQLGRIESPDARGLPEPNFDAISDLMETHETPWGSMSHLKPAFEMSETPPHWDRPAVPLGTHDPVWPMDSRTL